MSRYLVSGAAGFIGSHLAESLVAADHDVVGIDSFNDYYDPRLKEANAAALGVVRADLAEASIDDLLEGVDGVFHLAGQPGVRASFGDGFVHYLSRNVLASQRVFEAAARRGTRVVFASSSSIYGNAERLPTPEDVDPHPISPYGITKLACEHLARAYAERDRLDVVVLRYFTVYGPRQRPDMAFARIVTALAEERPFELYGDGSISRGFTYVADAVDATVAAMERAPSGRVYNVGGGVEATLREAIGVLESLAGRELEVVERAPAAGDPRRTSADTSRARRELSWEPSVGLEEGLAAQWAWATAGAPAR